MTEIEQRSYRETKLSLPTPTRTSWWARQVARVKVFNERWGVVPLWVDALLFMLSTAVVTFDVIEGDIAEVFLLVPLVFVYFIVNKTTREDSDAADRELFEEVGLGECANRLVPVFTAFDAYQYLCTTYMLVTSLSRDHTFVPESGHEVRWVPPSFLMQEEHSPFYRYYRNLFRSLGLLSGRWWKDEK